VEITIGNGFEGILADSGVAKVKTIEIVMRNTLKTMKKKFV